MKFMRDIILVISILFFGGSCYSSRSIKEEVLINHADIKVSNFADGVPYSQKIYEDFIQDKFVVMGVSPLNEGIISSISKEINWGRRSENILDAVANITETTIKYQYFLKYFSNTPCFRID